MQNKKKKKKFLIVFVNYLIVIHKEARSGAQCSTEQSILMFDFQTTRSLFDCTIHLHND
jgi:hypothetical protein